LGTLTETRRQILDAGIKLLRHRVLDFVLYIFIAASLLMIILYFASSMPEQQTIGVRWIGLAAGTTITFGYTLADIEDAVRNWRFYAALILMLSMHTVAFVVVLQSTQDVGLLTMWVINLLEMPLIRGVLNRVIYYRSVE
jgi:hypothetical protein